MFRNFCILAGGLALSATITWSAAADSSTLAGVRDPQVAHASGSANPPAPQPAPKPAAEARDGLQTATNVARGTSRAAASHGALRTRAMPAVSSGYKP